MDPWLSGYSLGGNGLTRGRIGRNRIGGRNFRRRIRAFRQTARTAEQFFKLLFLLFRQGLADSLPGFLQDAPHLRSNHLPDFTVPLLPLGHDLFNRPALLRRQVQRRVQPVHKICLQYLRPRDKILQCARRLILRAPICRMGMVDVINQQTAGEDTRAENHNRRENDFPYVHCA